MRWSPFEQRWGYGRGAAHREEKQHGFVHHLLLWLRLRLMLSGVLPNEGVDGRLRRRLLVDGVPRGARDRRAVGRGERLLAVRAAGGADAH